MDIITKISLYDDNKIQKYFDTEELKVLHDLKIHLDDIYYNTGGKSGLDDYQYDLLKDTLETRDPGYVVPIGAKIREGENRVKLPFWLGSMSKMKPDMISSITKWQTQNPSESYIIEDKLDGVSCLAIYNSGKIKLYTRGDGIVGADISPLAQYFKTLPKNLTDNIVVRGELIIPVDTFNKKYSKEFANPRNLVSGRIGAKTIKSGLSDIDFVAYEIVGTGTMESPSDQLAKLDKMGFTTVHREITNKFTVDTLMEMLVRFHNISPYEIDGIIIQPDIPYKRNTTGNPKYAFAFKMRLVGATVEATVEEVLWKPSKWGYYKPRIQVKPVKLSGVTITYATAFNAKFVKDNGIGPGAKVELIRSGDVIPYIIRIVLKAKGGAQMPKGDYEWNDTGVDIISTEETAEMCIARIEDFLKKIGVKYVGIKNVENMYNDGLNSVISIITAPQSRIANVPGYGEKGAERAYKNIQLALQNMDIPTVLGASGIFGRGMGTTKLEVLLDNIPDIFESYKKINKKKLYENIIKVPGFSDKSTEMIVNNIANADKFLNALRKIGTFTSKNAVVINKDKFKNMVAVFTGTRDKEVMQKVEEFGGKIGKSITNSTTILVYGGGKEDKDSNKMDKAKAKDIEILSTSEFIDKYLKEDSNTDISREDIKVVASIYTKSGSMGDFKWEIEQNVEPKTLYIFNDNVSSHKLATKGKGNAVIRPYNKYGKGKIIRSAGISTGYNTKGGFDSLNPEVKKIIDSEIDEIYELLDTGKYDTIKYSGTKDGSLGTNIFIVHDDVKRYIVENLHKYSIPIYSKYQCNGSCNKDGKIQPNGTEYDNFSFKDDIITNNLTIPEIKFKETEKYKVVPNEKGHLKGKTVYSSTTSHPNVSEDLYFNKDGSYTKIVNGILPEVYCKVHCKPIEKEVITRI
jgi:DNA ligase (NAD+)